MPMPRDFNLGIKPSPLLFSNTMAEKSAFTDDIKICCDLGLHSRSWWSTNVLYDSNKSSNYSDKARNGGVFMSRFSSMLTAMCLPEVGIAT